MEFTLYYRGPLKSNAKPKVKHALRKHFHRQLAELWNHPPLKGVTGLFKKDIKTSIISSVGDFDFASLVSDSIYMTADLNITLLRPEPPGAIIGQGGDIDNRLKTLFDALKAPSCSSDLPPDASPEPDETPVFHCLLKDDRLITGVSVSTAQLLEPVEDLTEAVVLIRVSTTTLRRSWATVDF